MTPIGADEAGENQPRRKVGSCFLSILMLGMASLTIVSALAALVDGLEYFQGYINNNTSLAEFRERREGWSLFWPALLVTAILWLWKSIRYGSRGRSPALILAGLALLGIATWTIPRDLGTRDSFVVRTWLCPKEMSQLDLEWKDPRCVALPVEEVSWVLVDEMTLSRDPLGNQIQPSTQTGNTSTWNELPDAEYVVFLATDADPARYAAVSIISIRDNRAWNRPENRLYGYHRSVPLWVRRIQLEDWLQAIDIYLFPPGQNSAGARL